MVKKIGGKALAVGTLIIAGAGYLAGILTAPKSGKETRNDIAKGAVKARRDAEKQLKRLHSDLGELIKEGNSKSKTVRSKARDDLQDATKNAMQAKEKAREILSALHNGDADDPNLQAVIEEIKLAKNNLVKYLKKTNK